MSTAAAKKLYFPSIDGLRLIASVNIVLFHFQEQGGFNDMHGGPAWLFRILKGPAFHASLFFILGGFIFAIKYLDSVDRFSTRSFVISRLKDLYPLHVVATLIMVPLMVLTGAAALGSPIDVGRLLYGLFMQLSLLWAVVPLELPAFPPVPLNGPSWALSAFFLCYILFKPLMHAVGSLNRRRDIVLWLALCFIPLSLGAALYIFSGCDLAFFKFLHVFAPLRVCEFVMGMLIARFFQLRAARRETKPSLADIPGINDILILLLFSAVYFNLWIRPKPIDDPAFIWVSYQVVMPALYCFLLYRFARGQGIVAWLFARKTVRDLGRSSFYPYLLHIPLVSWFCWLLEKWFGYRTFMHDPLQLSALVFLLYWLSMLYVRHGRKRKKHSVLKPSN